MIHYPHCHLILSLVGPHFSFGFCNSYLNLVPFLLRPRSEFVYRSLIHTSWVLLSVRPAWVVSLSIKWYLFLFSGMSSAILGSLLPIFLHYSFFSPSVFPPSSHSFLSRIPQLPPTSTCCTFPLFLCVISSISIPSWYLVRARILVAKGGSPPFSSSSTPTLSLLLA